jgi:long-chain acyl-CoA synthetase
MAPRILEPRMTRKPPFTVDTPGSKPAEGEAVPRRNARCPDRLTTQPDPEISTVFDIVLQGAKRWGTKEAVGVRKLIRTHEEVKKIKRTIDGEETEVEKKWTYYELGPYTYCSYNEYAALILQVGAGLRKLDINPGDKVHLFAQTT